MILKIMQEVSFARRRYFEKWGVDWVDKKIQHFNHLIPDNAKILDIGSGNCLLAYRLRKAGFTVTPIDIMDLSYSEKIKPVIYDGVTLPFSDNSFDFGLLLTVLHHSTEPVKVLKESARVCQELIIMEDIYSGSLDKLALLSADTIVNFGYSSLTFHHKKDKEWKELFNELGLSLQKDIHFKTLGIFKQVVYHVKKV